MEKKIVICGCKRGGKIDESSINKLKDDLEAKNVGYTFIEDMCGSIVSQQEKISELLSQDNTILIGCQSRALRSIALYSGLEDHVGLTTYHIDDTPSDLLSNEGSRVTEVDVIEYDGDWKPWYPVVDTDKCSSCNKCLNFCLFGVYTLDGKGVIEVSSPANCKDMCPACARVCPENAIIFPKHFDSPIDGGYSENVDNEPSVLDQLQSDDVYKVLNARRRKFKTSLLKKNQMKLAQEERLKCSKK